MGRIAEDFVKYLTINHLLKTYEREELVEVFDEYKQTHGITGMSFHDLLYVLKITPPLIRCHNTTIFFKGTPDWSNQKTENR